MTPLAESRALARRLLAATSIALLFSLAATAFLFDNEQRDRTLFLGVAAAWCASFSYGAGARRRTELRRLALVSAGLVGVAADDPTSEALAGSMGLRRHRRLGMRP